MDLKHLSIVLALLGCQIVLSAAGRPMHTVENLDRQLPVSQSDVETEGKPSPRSPISIHSTSSRRPLKLAPVISNSNDAFYAGGLATHDSNDFRPTTPGNSPGIGHKLVGYVQREVGKSKATTKSADVKHLEVAAVAKDFKPTTPGHSPGIGHVLGNKY